MRRTIATSILLLTAACSSAPSDLEDMESALSLAALNSKAPQVFVLGVAEGMAAEPVTLFDHTCQGVRYVHTVRDSIVLNPDGTAVRSFRLDRFADGDTLDGSLLVARGTWSRMTNIRNYHYFNQGPSILLTLKPDNPRVPSYTMPLRLDGPNTLSNLGAMGGSCGQAGDGREAQFKYTRRTMN